MTNTLITCEGERERRGGKQTGKGLRDRDGPKGSACVPVCVCVCVCVLVCSDLLHIVVLCMGYLKP